jgi:hypothetical protein
MFDDWKIQLEFMAREIADEIKLGNTEIDFVEMKARYPEVRVGLRMISKYVEEKYGVKCEK